MSRTYVCDSNGCSLVMEHPAISVQFCAIEDEDDDDPMDCECHYCGWVCLSAAATANALDYPPLQ